MMTDFFDFVSAFLLLLLLKVAVVIVVAVPAVET